MVTYLPLLTQGSAALTATLLSVPTERVGVEGIGRIGRIPNHAAHLLADIALHVLITQTGFLVVAEHILDTLDAGVEHLAGRSSIAVDSGLDARCLLGNVVVDTINVAFDATAEISQLAFQGSELTKHRVTEITQALGKASVHAGDLTRDVTNAGLQVVEGIGVAQVSFSNRRASATTTTDTAEAATEQERDCEQSQQAIATTAERTTTIVTAIATHGSTHVGQTVLTHNNTST